MAIEVSTNRASNMLVHLLKRFSDTTVVTDDQIVHVSTSILLRHAVATRHFLGLPISLPQGVFHLANCFPDLLKENRLFV